MNIDNFDLSKLKKEYQNNVPFPHIVIQNFWDTNQLSVAVDELEALPETIWTQNQDPTSKEMIVQKKKMALNKPSMFAGLAPNICHIMKAMNQKPMLEWLSELTGIPELIPDPDNLGGGVHRTCSGGKLSIHADFNLHPKTKLHRRINVLLYLNRDWLESWNGHLELWDPQMKTCVKKIPPIFNNMVVFTITEQALHGHPEPLTCPNDRSRLSLAFYYYTKDRPEEEKKPFHWAIWHPRPKLGY